ncbi:MAG: sigma-70 family RNA polymerase sigma factor [Armatimonadota bacterium]
MLTRNLTDGLLVVRSLAGDRAAYGALVDRYRGMAYAVAYSYVGDFDTASDLAQEVFVQVFQHLGALRETDRFAAYVRRIVVNECRAYFRERRRFVDRATVPEPSVHEQERSNNRLLVRQALGCLSLPTRQTVILYYFGEYSYEEIANFLSVPVTTIRSRLRDARVRLRKEMTAMIEETIQSAPLPPSFSDEVLKRLFSAAGLKDNRALQSLLTVNPQLASARYKTMPLFAERHIVEVAASGNNNEGFYELVGYGALDNMKPEEVQQMLYGATFHRNQQIAAVALQHGATLDVFAAAAMGDTRTVRRLLKNDPALVQARGPQGETPLHNAGNVETAQILLQHGADIEALDTTYGNTPAEFQSLTNRIVTTYLIERGASVSFYLACWMNDTDRAGKYLRANSGLLNERYGPKRPNGTALPIIAAASAGSLEVIEMLLKFGADVNTRDEKRDGETALFNAARGGYRELVAFLLEHGADPTIRTITSGKTARDCAIEGKQHTWQASVGIAEHDAVIALLTSHEAA